MPITTKLTGVKELIKKLKDFPDVIEEGAQLLADEAERLTKRTFDQEQTPDGKSWRPRKPAPTWVKEAWPDRSKGGKLLAPMKSTVTSKASSSGFEVSVGHGWAEGHQKGFSRGGKHPAKIPSRKMIPTGKIPAEWDESFEEILDDLIQDFLTS